MSIVKTLVDLQLKEAGYDVDYNYVIKNLSIDGVEWYEYYHWKNEEDYERFKQKAIEIINKQTNLDVRKDFYWFDAVWGLSAGFIDFVKQRIENDNKKNTSKKKGGTKKEKSKEVRE